MLRSIATVGSSRAEEKRGTTKNRIVVLTWRNPFPLSGRSFSPPQPLKMTNNGPHYSEYFDIPYTGAGSERQALDLYLPPSSSSSSPLLVYVHGMDLHPLESETVTD